MHQNLEQHRLELAQRTTQCEPTPEEQEEALQEHRAYCRRVIGGDNPLADYPNP